VDIGWQSTKGDSMTSIADFLPRWREWPGAWRVFDASFLITPIALRIRT